MKLTADVIAAVEFLSTQEGGRRTPTPGAFLGCPMLLNGRVFDCRLLLHEVGPVSPGEKVTVPVKFLDSDTARKIVRVGDTFELREGQPIATGEVLEIIAAGDG